MKQQTELTLPPPAMHTTSYHPINNYYSTLIISNTHCPKNNRNMYVKNKPVTDGADMSNLMCSVFIFGTVRLLELQKLLLVDNELQAKC